MSRDKDFDVDLFLSHFDTKRELVIFLNDMTINEIKEVIMEFEHHEMYKVCAIMQEVIDHKIDVMLEGFGFGTD